jgi:hypothetical protein
MDDELKRIVHAVLHDAELLDRDAVRRHCLELCAYAYQHRAPVPLKPALDVIRCLQKKRWFDLEETVAEVLVQTGQEALEIRRRLVQALIDQGKLTSAQMHLQKLIPDSVDDPNEHAEARGLLGRALKQRYVDANAPGIPRNAWALQRAITTYTAAYHETATDPLWHGINLVACLARARRDGVKVPHTMHDPHVLAGTLRTLAEETFATDPDNVWAAATALETCVALEDTEGAVLWAETYAGHARADAFEIGSTLRQLTEVWKLDAADGGIGELVLPVLRSGVLGKSDGSVQLSAGELQAELSTTTTDRLQRILGLDRFVSLGWYATGLERARAVARITDAYETPVGTGFLMRADALSERFGQGWVLLTNHHVVNTGGRRGLLPAHARAAFEALAPGRRAELHEVAEVLWSSPPDEYDVAVLRLKTLPAEAEHLAPYPIARQLPLVRRDPPERIYAIGHPLGAGLSFSLHDNLLVACKEPLLHYRTPTQQGSSGSPIFNRQWELLGIHHAGDEHVSPLNGETGRYEANEGISIRSISEAIAREAPAP